VAENGNVVDGSGKEIKSLTGKTLTISSTNKTISIKIGGKEILAPNGKAVRVALNGQVFDAGGFQVLAANGNPIFVDSVKKSLVDTSGSAVKVGDGQKVVGRIGKATN
jgi:flagellar basal body rod protein FlgG